MALYDEKIRSKSRREVRDVYSNYHVKDEIRNDFNYDRVDATYSKMYAGIDPRRRIEMAEGGMVKEDRNAMANLSNYGYQKEYSRNGYNSNVYIQDSVED